MQPGGHNSPDAQSKLIAWFNQKYPNPTSLMVAKYAKTYYLARMSGMSCDDLKQLAHLGVIKAVVNYDPSRGRLDSHALTWVRGEITNALHKTPLAKLQRAGKFELNDKDTEQRLSATLSANYEPRSDVRRNGFSGEQITQSKAGYSHWEDEALEAARIVIAELKAAGGKQAKIAEAMEHKFGLNGKEATPYRELGKLMGVSRTGAMNWINHGIARIRERLDQK